MGPLADWQGAGEHLRGAHRWRCACNVGDGRRASRAKKSIPIPDHLKAPSTVLDDEKVEMLVGVTSGSIHFERRMGVRRTCIQKYAPGEQC